MKLVLVIALLLAPSLSIAKGKEAKPAPAAPPAPSDVLTVQERHELEDMQAKRLDVQQTIAKVTSMLTAAFNVEALEVETRIRHAHEMKDSDTFDLGAGRVLRKPLEPAKPPATAPKLAPTKQ